MRHAPAATHALPLCGSAAERVPTWSPKNLVCWFFECSRMASTRVQASGCSCTALSTASAAERCSRRAGRARVGEQAGTARQLLAAAFPDA